MRAIALERDVKLSPEHRRNDAEIAATIECTLAWTSVLPRDRVQVTVDKGWVTLRGELDWEYQRAGVDKAVRPLIGVVGISNGITLKPRVTAGGVAAGIEQALKRQAEREAKRVEVDVVGSAVTLRGTVHSWQERDAAAGAAWSAPGVLTVINELRVSG